MTGSVATGPPLPPLTLLWRTTDRERTLALLRSCGLVPSDAVFELGLMTLEVIASEDGEERLEVAGPAADASGRSPAAPAGARRPEMELVALGWATVDAERLSRTLGRSLEDSRHEDPALGAVGHPIASSSLPLVLLEPATEGRIAAALARLGEGPAVLYLTGAMAADALMTPSSGTGVGRPGRLVRPSRPSGPYIVILDRPADLDDASDPDPASPDVTR